MTTRNEVMFKSYDVVVNGNFITFFDMAVLSKWTMIDVWTTTSDKTISIYACTRNKVPQLDV